MNITESDKEFMNVINSENTAKADRSDVRIMSVNLLAHYESWGGCPVKPRSEIFSQILNAYTPDVVGLQEICEDWTYCLIEDLPDSYSFIHPVSEEKGASMTTMIYNTDTLELIDSGDLIFSKGNNSRTRRAAWAVFETINDNRRFAVTSTHFDFIVQGKEAVSLETMNVQADEMYELSEKIRTDYNCAVFLTGDFNTKEGNAEASQIYNKLNAVLTDAKYCAQYTFAGEEKSIEQPNIDHIFVNGNATVITFGLLSDSYLNKMSDHYPIIADIML